MELLEAPLAPHETSLAAAVTEGIASARQKDLQEVLDNYWPDELGPRPTRGDHESVARAPSEGRADEAAAAATFSLALPRWLFEVDDANAQLAADGFGAPTTRAAGALLRLLAPYGEVKAVRELRHADGSPSGRCSVEMGSEAEATSAVEGLRVQGLRV